MSFYFYYKVFNSATEFKDYIITIRIGESQKIIRVKKILCTHICQRVKFWLFQKLWIELESKILKTYISTEIGLILSRWKVSKDFAILSKVL